MSSDRLKILLIEDDEEDALIVKKLFEKASPSIFELECLSQLKGTTERIAKGGLDLILLDLFLPDSDGIQTLREIRDHAPLIPVIVLTNLVDESAALEAVNNGAQDYLVKGELNSSFFLRTIRHAIERHRIRLELDVANRRLEQLTLVDPLTGILNRRGLQQILSGQMQRASRESDMLALLIDLDDFKYVNDSLGHAVGDVVLNEVTRRLKAALRSSDHAARIGGDEFVLLLPETRMAEGIHVAEKVRLAIAGHPVVLSPEKQIKVTASLGLVSVAPTISSIDELLIITHEALAKSKKSGKNQVSYEAKWIRNSVSLNDVENIHRQLIKRPFRALKQGIFQLNELKEVGCEFLSRSSISYYEMPDDFFRVSLENNMLTLVDHECFKICISASEQFSNAGLRFHLNLFPSTLIDIPVQNLIQELTQADQRITFCIEISEQQIIGDPSYLLKPVEALKKAGVLIAIDDVGFGRSCFESLILLEPHIIKADKGCITGVSKDKARIRSLQRMLNVARVLETEVIAEGIETKEDLNVLKDLGVKYGQGYFLEKPQECAEKILV